MVVVLGVLLTIYFKKDKVQSNVSKEVDGIKITVKGTRSEPVKGDSNEDGSPNSSGEFFTLGEDILLASSYEYKIVDVLVENNNDKPIKLFQTGWNAVNTSEYEFENIEVTGKLDNQQVEPGESFDAQVKIPVEHALEVKELKLKYNLKDYSNLPNVLEDALNGLSVEDAQKKYPELYIDNWIELGTIKFE
ncbi:TPA: hypothetical protein KOY34_003625 [Clostridioides difficile]|nr:hypothetical protein [Clostridioides difficile]HBE8153240.1 hypothetical protein [Clostridioides difficile]HBE9240878.1 hypothetical protein [Clostridioides difficile]HBE9908327.1 hypothetical protein [Clostridioides difficile]HBF3543085.1 hypothetical protein [Clostridioides difficile]HBF4066429.1 hypothetical protein [Clostridioides difficile]